MAKLTTKTNRGPNPEVQDTAILLEPREAYFQPINLGDWTEVLIGCFYSATTRFLEDSDFIDEPNTLNIITNNDPTNYFYFGLKNNFAALPREVSEYFVGISMLESGGKISYDTNASNSTIELPQISFTTCRNDGNFDSDLRITPAPFFKRDFVGNDENYCGSFVLRIRINNKGLPNQIVEMQAAFDAVSESTAPYDVNNLRTVMSNGLAEINNLSQITHDFNVNGVPLSPPDTLIYYVPFHNMRMKIHAWAVEKLQ